MDQTSASHLVLKAKEAGMPRDQLECFLKTAYVPLPWQLSFHALARAADDPNGPVHIGVGGARGPGKSHACFAQVAIDDCQRADNLKVLFLRKTAVSAKESFEDLIGRIISQKISFNRSGNVISFPNRSKIILGGFNNEDDIDKYVGIEYDVEVIEELNQLTEDKFKKLEGSLRTSKPTWRPRIYASFNPGGVGHSFVKSHFVLPYRLRNETRTAFIPATYIENRFLNKEYIEYLEGLTGDLGKAWREGEFDLFAGQYFTEWSYDVHVISPFAIPDDWRRFKAGDYGHGKPASIGWYAISPDGKLYRYKELYGAGMSYSKLAEEAVALTNPTEKIDYEVWDPAIWSKKGERDDELTGAEVYARRIRELTGKDPRLIRGDNARVIGWGVTREYLRPYQQDDNLTANLQVFSTCQNLIRTLPELQHDEKNPEDLDSDGEDHAADELRYALMSRPKPNATTEQIAKREFNEMIRRKRLREGKRRDKLFIKS